MIDEQNPAEAEDLEQDVDQFNDDDAYEKAFSEWNDSQEKPDKEPEKVEPETPEEPEEPQEDPEPFPGYKNLPDEARQAYDQATARAADWENRWKAQHGQLGPAQRQLSQYQKRTQELERVVEELKKKQPEEDPVAKAKREQWEKDFPDEAEAMKSQLTPIQRKLEEAEARLAKTAEAQEQFQRQVYVREQQAELTKAHPDWREISQSEPFRIWASSLDEDDAALLDRMDAQSNIKMLNRFKQDLWIAEQEHKRVNEGQQQPPSKPSKPARSEVAPTSRTRQSGVARPNPEWDEYETQFADWAASQGIKV